MPDQRVITHNTPDELAHAVAARLITRLVDVQSDGRAPSVVLTGGTIAEKIHRAVAQSPAHGAVDWGRVDFWFGDERFVAADSPDRNMVQAAAAMLDQLPVDPARVHPMPSAGGEYGDDVDAAAEAYAEELRSAASPDGATPVFDVLMLGIGPDGHCASLFPGHPAVHDDRPVVAVRNSPKPPPTRISLTLEPLRRADQVWWVAAGSEKAQAVQNAVSGADPAEVPAAGPRGLSRTLWLLDREAAAKLSR
jgi:6-phosphogluconolactonase